MQHLQQTWDFPQHVTLTCVHAGQGPVHSKEGVPHFTQIPAEFWSFGIFPVPTGQSPFPSLPSCSSHPSFPEATSSKEPQQVPYSQGLKSTFV